MHDRDAAAEELLSAFLARTGAVTPASVPPSRYLWTDAFAVCGLLALHRRAGDGPHLDRAVRLVEQVHRVLGRHREDDPRTGWISGLGDREGELHPTCGGLRIGKPLGERGPLERYDERREWERDGQYFHYLTKWMHALDRLGRVTGASQYGVWARELAAAAYDAFVYTPDHGGSSRMYWKMSIDLSRPLVPSMGGHDPLDGFVTFSRLQASGGGAAPDLGRAVTGLLGMCRGVNWATGDELGIGGLLSDAHQLMRLVADGHLAHPPLLDSVLRDTEHSLDYYEVCNRLDEPVEHRLAFRELGLAIGLHAVEPMRDAIHAHPDRFTDHEALAARLDAIAQHVPLADAIERYWLQPAHQLAVSWTAHRDINSVMLATSLAPDVYLMSAPDGSYAAARD